MTNDVRNVTTATTDCHNGWEQCDASQWGADIGLVTTRHFERRYEIIGNTCESKMQLRRGGALIGLVNCDAPETWSFLQ